jgi:hypothetical protein
LRGLNIDFQFYCLPDLQRSYHSIRIEAALTCCQSFAKSLPLALMLCLVPISRRDSFYSNWALFVACSGDFSLHHHNFFVENLFYDSLKRAKKRIHEANTAAATLMKVNLFFSKRILHKKNYLSLRQLDNDMNRQVQYKDSPLQNNGCDCGSFAVATSLHLAEHIPLTTKSFSETHITESGSELAKTLCSESAVMASAVFRDCFILL